MINAKRIYIECKKSMNFQTYTVGIDAEIEIPMDTYEGNDKLDETIKGIQAKCRKLVMEQIAIDKK